MSKLFHGAVITGVLLLCVGSYTARAEAPKSIAEILAQFTAADVPTTGPAEMTVAQRWTPAPPPAGLPGKGIAQHAMLIAGEGCNKLFLVNNGKVIWTYSCGGKGEIDDVWLLSNGNVLYTRQFSIEEVTPKKEVIWHYDVPQGSEIHTCQPIGLDKVMFVLQGLPPKLMMYDAKTKKMETLHELPAVSKTDPKTVHTQFRRFRLTDKGTYLAPFLKMDKVVEFDKDFNEIWSYSIPTPWTAFRLKNGNTMITSEKDKLTREVNPKGETVWEIKPSDLPKGLTLANTQSCVRLASGNTVICSQGARGKSFQMIELTPDKKVVWVLQDWEKLGPATAIQILDDPGTPEKPGDCQK